MKALPSIVFFYVHTISSAGEERKHKTERTHTSSLIHPSNK